MKSREEIYGTHFIAQQNFITLCPASNYYFVIHHITTTTFLQRILFKLIIYLNEKMGNSMKSNS